MVDPIVLRTFWPFKGGSVAINGDIANQLINAKNWLGCQSLGVIGLITLKSCLKDLGQTQTCSNMFRSESCSKSPKELHKNRGLGIALGSSHWDFTFRRLQGWFAVASVSAPQANRRPWNASPGLNVWEALVVSAPCGSRCVNRTGGAAVTAELAIWRTSGQEKMHRTMMNHGSRSCC